MSDKPWGPQKDSPFLRARSKTTRVPLVLQALGYCALAVTLTILASNYYLITGFGYNGSSGRVQRIPLNAQQILSKCASLNAIPGSPANFAAREVSDRFENGTKPTLIRDATIWTGRDNGTEVIFGDVLLDKGLVKGIGHIPPHYLQATSDLQIVDAYRAWVTPGLVDLHTHLGLMSAPLLGGANDVNSPNGPIVPYLRSIDGFNTHDEAVQLAVAGGVTTAQVLPGSGNAIAGQAFMMKLRPTSDRSPSSMVLEPPESLNGSSIDSFTPPRWRHMKQTMGENLRAFGTRMDSVWSLRAAYHQARQTKSIQDAFCQNAQAGLWESIDGNFPEDLKMEMLVDVLRGKVKLSTHTYEAVDLDDLVRLSNEFEFPLGSIHHAAEAWLVPDLLKRAWGGPPAVALFATNYRYKREAFRGSEFAPRVLADNNISVIMKSDHPIQNARYLSYEAQQAHYFGLQPGLALASITSAPATAAGVEHRVGLLIEGADADVVIWDSHPLQIGATPVKVWIDGIPQIPVPPKTGQETGDVTVGKGKDGPEWRQVPRVPNWDEERKIADEWDGLPPLQGMKEPENVIFTNVRNLWTKKNHAIEETRFAEAASDDGLGVVLVENGNITCAGTAATCVTPQTASGHRLVDLQGGSISPGLMSFGSLLGLQEIDAEPSTGDGPLYNPFAEDIPAILGDVGGVLKAVDALQFGTRNALLAHRAGVTVATVSLSSKDRTFGHASMISGLSTTFRTGGAHALQRGAVVQNVAALHVVVGRPSPLGNYAAASVSEEIATLRRLLFGFEDKWTQTGKWFKDAIEGIVPLVIEVDSADIMATLLNLKAEAEERWGTTMRVVFSGAAEAHILAKEIGDAGVGVILNPIRPYPGVWDQRRVLPGPPLTNDSTLVTLIDNGVTVGVGITDAWMAPNTRFDLSWVVATSNGRINEEQAYAMFTTNLERLLGVVNLENVASDLVAYAGGSACDLSSKVVAVLSPERGVVDLV